jgi:hypothetical protein
MGKENVIYIHNGVPYSATKKNVIISLAGNWMELEAIMLSTISQVQKDKYQLVSLICRL